MAYIPPSKKRKKKKKKKIKSRFPVGEYGIIDESQMEMTILGFEKGGVGDYTFEKESGVWKHEDGHIVSGEQLLKGLSEQLEYDLTQLPEFEQYNTTVGHNADISSIEKKTEKVVEKETTGITNLDWIVDNIWEPHELKGINQEGMQSGYGTDWNGKALFDYLGQFGEIAEGEMGMNPTVYTEGNDDALYVPNRKNATHVVAFRGEYIHVWDMNAWKSGRSLLHATKWGGDSWGGKSKDKKDIMEIFKVLGIDSHLTETR